MIHRFEQNGIYIILDVYSGAVHIADRLIYDLLGEIDSDSIKTGKIPESIISSLSGRFAADEICEAFCEVCELYSAGLLYSEDTYGDLGEYGGGEIPVKALCLHVSHDCNMRCKYCFASTGDFGGERSLMNLETAKRAIDFVVKKSGKRRNIEIDFFGGEPLMAFDVVRGTVEYACAIEKEHNKNFRFTITTNGLLLNAENILYINENMSNIVLSLDGRKEVNDRLRVLPNGSGTYDAIVEKFQKLIAGRGNKDYYLRGTFTGFNKDFSNDVLHMAKIGFKNLSVEPVVCNLSEPYALHEEDIPSIFAEYDRLTDALVDMRKRGEGVTFFHFMVDLSQGPCVIKRVKGCGAGGEYLAVTPTGEIYPCHQFVGQQGYRMGNVFEGEINERISKSFASVTLNSRAKCRNCWAKYYCSGGCSAANYFQNRDILEPYALGCEMEKKRLECAIYMASISKTTPYEVN